MKKSIITKYMDYCIISGRPDPEIHHCIEGIANRKLADDDGLVIPLLPEYHNSSKNSVHQNHALNVFSHIIGQLAWEKEYYKKRVLPDNSAELDPAREEFRQRYGRSYL